MHSDGTPTDALDADCSIWLGCGKKFCFDLLFFSVGRYVGLNGAKYVVCDDFTNVIDTVVKCGVLGKVTLPQRINLTNALNGS